MAGKKVRSRTSQNPVSISNITSRPTGSAGPKRVSVEDLPSLTKQQLQVECRKRGQKTTGNRTDLLQRLGYKMSKRNTTTPLTSNGSTTGDQMQQQQNNTKQQATRKRKEKEEREGLVLWKRPISTLEYSAKELFVLLKIYGNKLLEYKILVLMLTLSIVISVVLLQTSGPHQTVLAPLYKQFLWCAYWTGLGILSSVGLGTGLHTFILYLGPHIAQVTLAAYECGSLNFPEPPYPDEIVCPQEKGNSALITIFSIMSKVRLEAMCWGAGTALGELPPYFMARAARLSGIDPEDEDDDLAEFEELQKKRKEDLTLIEKGKLFVEQLVQKVGFFGILACASIPNPLFDLAGITCGHFLVPFWTFFGATLIGKAIIKMHIQKLFVIIAFNETLIDKALSWLTVIPVIGQKLELPFRSVLNSQKSKLHSSGGTASPERSSIISSIFEKFVFAMILYFIISIVNSFAQSYHKRLCKKKAAKVTKD